MSKIKTAFPILCLSVLIFNMFPQICLASWDYAQERKVLLDQEFYKPYMQQTDENDVTTTYISGWDIDEAGGSVSEGLKIIDNSSSLPINLKRQFEEVIGSSLTIEFRFEFATVMNGARWKLNADSVSGVSFIMNNGNLCMERSGQSPLVLSACSVNTEYGVKAQLNLDTQTVKIYVNGALAANNIAFTNAVTSLNIFELDTGNAATGEMNFYKVKIYRGYLINEKFLTSFYNVPADWTSSVNGGSIVGAVKFSDEGRDWFSLLLTGSGGACNISKKIGLQSNRIILEYNTMFESTANGAYAMLKHGQSNIFGITTNGGDLCYLNRYGTYTSFYSYQTNFWYNIKIDLDIRNHMATIYVNGKKLVDGAYITVSPVDSVFFGVDSGASSYIDDISLYQHTKEPDDYVPEPQPVTSDYLLGMQSCSIWTEGSHIGWDRINAVPERKPYLGFYDENSPELADWEIKYMIEHGINFEVFCWFRPYVYEQHPIKHAPSVNGALHEGYFNAKYSDQLKFMIMWENGMYNHESQFNASTDFVTNIIPYWIEYYFKDPRYLKIGDRPVVSIYRYNQFVNQFGGTAGAAAALEELRDACDEADIGDPIIYASGSDIITQSDGTQMASVGFQGAYKYNYSGVETEMQKQILEFERDENLSNGFEIVPTMSMGFNGFAWSNRATGVANTPTEFSSLLDWTKDDFIETLPSSWISKKMVIMASWNEFGEGHYIMPAKLHGFAYLDAIRTNFIGTAPHEDIVPNDAQKDRFNNLYYSEREVPLQTFVSDAKPIPSTYDVIGGWYFNTNGNLEGWGSVQHITGLEANGGSLNGVASGSDPILMSPYNLGIDISDVDFIKIRMRVNVEPIITSSSIYFITNDSQSWDEGKSFYFNLGYDRGQMRDYYIQVDNNSAWTGTLKHLRVDPMSSAVKFAGQDNFSIDSIELIKGTS